MLSLSKKTEQQINELIGAVAIAAHCVYKDGGSDPATLEALANLITAARGDPPSDSSPCIGFILPAPATEEFNE